MVPKPQIGIWNPQLQYSVHQHVAHVPNMHLANLAQRGEIRIPSLTKLKLFLMFFVLRTSTDNVLPMTPATATADSTTPSHQYANTLTGYHMLIFL